jgi:ferredoxin-NADP reductase
VLTAVEIAGLLVVVGALAQVAVQLAFASWRGARSIALQQTEIEVFRRQAEVYLEAARSERDRALGSWSGARKLVIVRKELEALGSYSFYLEPHDRQPIPPFMPGQHLRLDLRLPGEVRPVVRCYSLSRGPRDSSYRITVKRLETRAEDGSLHRGLASCHLCDSLEVGDILDAHAPSGGFTLDRRSERPVVLIGGGIGITPLLAMIDSLFELPTGSPVSQRTSALPIIAMPRETWLFYGVRHRGEEIEGDRLRLLAREHPGLHLVICHSRDQDDTGPDGGAETGRDTDDPFSHRGRIDMELLRQHLGSSNFVYYLCGPSGMMQDLTSGLRSWGVPEKDIRFEAFGPASVVAAPGEPHLASGQALNVEFARSGVRCSWKPESGSLLDLAEAEGIALDSGCRAGSCGSCTAAIKQGEVRYTKPPGADPGQGSCLTCVAIPDTALVLDA